MLTLLVVALLLQPECEPCPVPTPPVLAKVVEGGLEFDALHTHSFSCLAVSVSTAGNELEEQERRARARPVSELTRFPELTRFVVPRVGEAARNCTAAGRVVVEILLDSAGKVRRSTVQESDSCLLEVQTLEAVARMGFAPAEIDGNPVWSIVRIPFTFSFDQVEEARAQERPTTVDEWIEHVDVWANSAALGEWERALVEFTVESQASHQPDPNLWPRYTEVQASDLRVIAGLVEPEANFRMDATASDHPHHGIVYGAINGADLWLRRGDRVIAFVVRYPESELPLGASRNRTTLLWRIRNVLQVDESGVFLVTKVTPRSDLEWSSDAADPGPGGFVSRDEYSVPWEYSRFEAAVTAKAANWQVKE